MRFPSLRISLTNVQGEGASHLVGSLLPALEAQTATAIRRVDLPDRGALSTYRVLDPGTLQRTYRRRLPNALSRLFECLRPLADDDGMPLLVLGDLPLRSKGIQTVFVHNTHVLARQAGVSGRQAVKFASMRAVFRHNLRHATQVVVQTELMRRNLVASYPILEGRVCVIRQPPPAWLLAHPAALRTATRSARLRLFYPAAAYPHKNHGLIAQLAHHSIVIGAVDEIVVTLDPFGRKPSQGLIQYVGHLDPEAMRDRYSRTDALFFPSLSESYGLPLVEAMWLGLPIVCSDLPYAHELCGNQAFYFNPHDVHSAAAAIDTLASRVAQGWCPDWSQALANIPRDWNNVASQLLAIAVGSEA